MHIDAKFLKQGCHAIGQPQAMLGRRRLQMLLGCNTQSRMATSS
jgi:hypothetical protein